MTNDELLKSYMDQLVRDQQNYRGDMCAMQARMEILQARSDVRKEAIRRDIDTWSAFGVVAAVIGTIVAIMR